MADYNDNAVLIEKIEQILSTVTDIKNEIKLHSEQINKVNIKMALLEEKDATQQKELDNIKSENAKMKWQILGCISGIVVAVVASLLKGLIGV